MAFSFKIYPLFNKTRNSMFSITNHFRLIYHIPAGRPDPAKPGSWVAQSQNQGGPYFNVLNILRSYLGRFSSDMVLAEKLTAERIQKMMTISDQRLRETEAFLLFQNS